MFFPHSRKLAAEVREPSEASRKLVAGVHRPSGNARKYAAGLRWDIGKICCHCS